MTGFLVFTVAAILIAFFLYSKQNTDRTVFKLVRCQHTWGGAISKAKASWIFYVVYTWFILLPYLIFFLDAPLPWKLIWGIFSLSMWIRGAAEITTLFVTKTWTPVLGLGHDLLCFIWLIAASVYHWETIFLHLELWHLVFHLHLVLGIALETWYAWGFVKLVGQGRMEDETIWYAAEQDPMFRWRNRATAFFNVPLYLNLVLFLGYLAVGP